MNTLPCKIHSYFLSDAPESKSGVVRYYRSHKGHDKPRFQFWRLRFFGAIYKDFIKNLQNTYFSIDLCTLLYYSVYIDC